MTCIRELEEKHKARNVISRSGLCVGKPRGGGGGGDCALRRKTRGKHLCKGRMIIPTAKMACIASVEPGNCLLVSLESFESEK